MGKGLRTGTHLSVLSLPRLWRGSLPFTFRFAPSFWKDTSNGGAQPRAATPSEVP